LLGRGSYGEVRKAKHKVTNAIRAIKIMKKRGIIVTSDYR